MCLYAQGGFHGGRDYKLCFDNSFSTISEKLVFFELIFDSLQDEEEVEGWAEAVEPEGDFWMSRWRTSRCAQES